MKQKVLLMILDGWGIGNRSKGDVISTVHPAYISAMTEKYPHAQLHTDGENVGLPDGQMGNSEVGHLNIGAGRVVYQDLVKINRACKDGSIMENAEVKAAFEYAKAKGVNVHFMGLVSDGGVHSSIDHLYKLCDIAKTYGIEHTYVHCFMDGRDTDPHSGKGFLADLQAKLDQRDETIASLNEDKESKKMQISMLGNQIESMSAELSSANDKIHEMTVETEALKSELQNLLSQQDNQAQIDELNAEIKRLKASNEELSSALEAAKGNARFVSELEDSLDELIECIRESADKIKANAQQEAEAIIQNAREKARNIELERLRSNADSSSRILSKLARFRDALIK